jgi:WD40 repeat protein
MPKCLAFSPNGKILALSDNQTISLYDVISARSLGMIRECESEITYLAFSADNTMLTGGGKGMVYLWNVEDQRLLMNERLGENFEVRCLALSSDNKKLAIGNQRGEVKLWSLETNKLLRTLEVDSYGNPCVCLMFVEHDQQLIVTTASDSLRSSFLETRRWGGHSMSMQLQNVETGEFYRRFILPPGGATECLALSPTDTNVVASGQAENLVLWNVKDQDKLCVTLAHREALIKCLAFSSEGNLLASGDGNGSVHLWKVAENYKNLTLIDTLHCGEQPIKALHWQTETNLHVINQEGEVSCHSLQSQAAAAPSSTHFFHQQNGGAQEDTKEVDEENNKAAESAADSSSRRLVV